MVIRFLLAVLLLQLNIIGFLAMAFLAHAVRTEREWRKMKAQLLQRRE